MMNSSLRTTATIVASLLMTTVMWSTVNAQTQRGYKDPLAPKTSPADKKLREFFNRGVPQTKTDRAAKRLFKDPLRKFGLPKNRLNDPDGPTAPSVTEPVFDPGIAHLDADGDGTVSRSEYFQGRTRLVSPGRDSDRRTRSLQRRLDSRFRQADSNGDGVVSPAELQATGGARF